MAKAVKTNHDGKAPRTQQQRRDATSAAVLESAMKLFGEKGYQHTSLEDIAQDCGTTIRPIYHYYKSKKKLFLAVAEAREDYLFQVLEGIEKDTQQPLPLSEYWRVFTQVCQEPGFRQTVLIDAPNILGRERWESSPIVEKAIDYFFTLYPNLTDQSRMLISRVLVAALIEAAMVLSESDGEGQPSFEELFAMFETITGIRS